MNNKILILNGSHSEISIIQAAKNLGFYVITAGNDETGIGHNYSDQHINIDYTDKSSLLSFCTINEITNIVPCANDLCIETFIFLKKNLKFDYFDTIENLEIIQIS